MSALYNEIEPYAADWIENLVRAGHVSDGVVDRRSIADLTADDVRGHRQCHFFAGIAVWSAALRAAGWPGDLGVWTGSCPCQPLSQAGRQRGFEDERHLWPEWFRLICECRPPIVCGEQVASKLGLAWLDVVFADLEGAGYACWACDLAAACVGAPHIRQRLYFVAVRGDLLGGPGARAELARYLGDAGLARGGRDAGAVPRSQGESAGERLGAGSVTDEPGAAGATHGAACAVGDATDTRRGNTEDARADRGNAGELIPWECGRSAGGIEPERASATGACAVAYAELHHRPGRIGEPHGRAQVEPDRYGDARPLAHGGGGDGLQGSRDHGSTPRAIGQCRASRPLADDDDDDGRESERAARLRQDGVAQHGDDADGRGPTNGYWADAEWIPCRDGKWRPIERRVPVWRSDTGDGLTASEARPAQPGALEVADGPAAWLERVRTAGPLVEWKALPDPKPSRAGMLKAYGNAIVKPLATVFIETVLEVLQELAR